MLAMLAALAFGAPTGPWVRVECPTIDSAELNRLVRIELEGQRPRVEVEVRCEGAAIEVRLATGGEVQRRPVQVPTAEREVVHRYVAVEVAELIAASAGPSLDPQPRLEPVPGPPRRARPRFTRWGWLTLGARGELGGQPAMGTGGGQVQLGGVVLPRLALRVRGGGTVGGRRLAPGRLRQGAAWGSAEVLAALGQRRTAVLLGAGARVEGIWLTGQGDGAGVAGAQHRGASGSPLISATVVLRLGARLVMSTGLDGGWSLRPVRGLRGAEVVFSSGGPWAGITLGLGAIFGDRMSSFWGPRATPDSEDTVSRGAR